MRKVLLSMSLAAFAASATAQCLDQAYGTSLGSGGDVMFSIQPIGFAFPFCGTTYTDIHITDKGYVHLSNAGMPANPGFADIEANPLDLITGAPLITALWSDIQCLAANNGEVFLKSTPTTCTITWRNAQCYNQNSGIFDMQMELSISGTIKLLFGPGTTNNSEPTQPTWFAGLCGVSPGTGTLPAASDLSASGATANNILFEAFPIANTFDLASNGLLLIPNNPGWTYITLGAPVNCASTTVYGAGCVEQSDSVYEEFTSSFDLNNTTITWLRTATGYTMLTGIPGTIVPPSGSATNVASGFLDGEQVVTLTTPMPVPGGTTSAFNITTKGQVEFANTTNGFVQFVPVVEDLLGWSRTAFHCWHDFNQTDVGSGLILFEQVGGTAYATWNGVHSWSNSSPSTFQFQFDLATGNVTLVMGVMNGVANPDSIIIGYSVGGASNDPGPTDLSAVTGTVDVFDVGTTGLALAPIGAPQLGNASFALETSDVPNIVPLAFTFFGDTVINPGVDLTFLGMPGCAAYTNGNLVAVTVPVSLPAGVGSVVLPIPNNPTLIGATLTSQSVAFSTATPANLITSNGVSFTVGN